MSEVMNMIGDINRKVEVVDIPLRYRLKYWSYYLGLAHRGKMDENSAKDADYQDSFVKRGYDKARQKICDHVTSNYQKQPTPHEVPIIDVKTATAADIEALKSAKVPFVIRGGSSHWEAVKSWNLDFFDQHYGDFEVPVNQANDRPAADKTKPTKAFNYYDIRMGSMREVTESARQDKNIRVVAIEDIMHEKEGALLKDLHLDEIEQFSGWEKNKDKFAGKKLFRGKLISKQLFIQPPSAFTIWHCEPGDNFFVQCQGKKTWTLAHPMHTAGFDPRVKKQTTYHGSNIDIREGDDAIEARGFEMYPYIPKFEVEVVQGDILYVPNYWWHTVTNVPEQYTISVTIRSVAGFNMTGPAYYLLWLMDKDNLELKKKMQKYGRITDDDVNKKIFGYLDKSNRF